MGSSPRSATSLGEPAKQAFAAAWWWEQGHRCVARTDKGGSTKGHGDVKTCFCPAAGASRAAPACCPTPPPRSYEGRCSLPSNFDATYCNALGQAAGALTSAGQTGIMATLSSETGGSVGGVCGWVVGWGEGGNRRESSRHG